MAYSSVSIRCFFSMKFQFNVFIEHEFHQSFYHKPFNSMQSDYNVHVIRETIQVFACIAVCRATNLLISTKLTNCKLFRG